MKGRYTILAVQLQENESYGKLKLFTNPKTVKKQTARRIFLTQIKICCGIIVFIVLLKLTVPQVYDNVSQYINSFLIC